MKYKSGMVDSPRQRFASYVGLVALALVAQTRGQTVPATRPTTTANLPLPTVVQDGGRVAVRSDRLVVEIDLANDGRVSIHWNNGVRLDGVRSTAVLADAREAAVLAARPHGDVSHEVVRDGFGDGVCLTTIGRGGNGVELRRRVWIYAGRDEVFTQVDIAAPAGGIAATRHIEPLLIDDSPVARASGIRLNTAGRPLNLFVPYDNDGYSRYAVDQSDGHSYEVGAVFDPESRRGIVIGSVTHDLWKTRVDIGGLNDGGATQLRVTAGAVDKQATFDTQPHGVVRGAVVSSPRVFVGAFEDWRDGLEAFGRANAVLRPALAWTGARPVGWNSWAAHKASLNAAHVTAAIEAVADLRGHGWSAGGTAYVNLDSYWDNLSDAALADLSRRTHARGLRFGLYFAPFCGWDGNLDHVVPGTGERFRYRDIVLKDAAGQPLPKHDGAWPLDPTHPGTRMRNDAVFARFAKIGVDFLKLDFLTHGALEGQHHDPAIATGTAAYNAGMRDVLAALSTEKMGGPVFVSLSIAPLFPHGYGHARRTSCDAFGTIGATDYLLNSQTFGWWTHNTLYRFNDPDHSVVYQTAGERVSTEAEAHSRLNASLISGGLLLASDDATNLPARTRMLSLLTSDAVKALLPRDTAFRPVDVLAGSGATMAFVSSGPDQAMAAAFNVSPDRSSRCDVPLARLGLPNAAKAIDIETGRPVGSLAGGVLRLDLAARSSVIVRLESK